MRLSFRFGSDGIADRDDRVVRGALTYASVTASPPKMSGAAGRAKINSNVESVIGTPPFLATCPPHQCYVGSHHAAGDESGT